MRVITGNLRGRKLKTLDSMDTRPTTDMVKEAIFSAIQFDVPGAECLDLFAGSGQMGIEAVSRDAYYCGFVDSNPAAVEVIKGNISDCKIEKLTRVFPVDSFEYLRTAKRMVDIIFMDPPYGKGLLQRALVECDRILNDKAIVVCEHEKELVLDEEYGRLKLHKRYRYGKIGVTIFKIPENED